MQPIRMAWCALITVVLNLPALAAGPHHLLDLEQPNGEGSAIASAEPGPKPRRTSGRTDVAVDPFTLISGDRMLETLERLTGIGAYRGWRTSASSGEAAALQYVEAELDGLHYLRALGLDVEEQRFHTFLGTELWECRLWLRRNGQEIEVPANGLQGLRDDLLKTLRFDSDGALNDTDPDPVEVSGTVVTVHSAAELAALSAAQLAGTLVFLDYAAIDTNVVDTETAQAIAEELLGKGPAGVVMVSEFSNRIGDSFGTFIGSSSALVRVDGVPAAPVLHVRLEDLAAAGVSSWAALAGVEAARLRWDADVLAPGISGNLIARIPGADASHAVILGAHIDSPNTPGALDDGSGSTILLEVAQVLDQAREQPPVDLYLVWFGSEERGLYGSTHFINTHQDLLRRTLAMLEIDGLGYSLDGINDSLTLKSWPNSMSGDPRPRFGEYLAQAASAHGVWVQPFVNYSFGSDNGPFSSHDVPNANLLDADYNETAPVGSFHYLRHWHDPYDTVELAREEIEVLRDMARVVLVTALQLGADLPQLRVTPAPDRRVLYVASHTEVAHMSSAAMVVLNMLLAWQGFAVDLVPHGRAVTAGDLVDADLVIVLPVIDYPSDDGDVAVYDEAWTDAETGALAAYVAGGGMLVLTNSAHRLKFFNAVWESNEDWPDVNALGSLFGITYQDGSIADTECQTIGHSPLVGGVDSLHLLEGNGVPFSFARGQSLASCNGIIGAALVEHGNGEVLVLADVGLLGTVVDVPNLPFWESLAAYVRNR